MKKLSNVKTFQMNVHSKNLVHQCMIVCGRQFLKYRFGEKYGKKILNNILADNTKLFSPESQKVFNKKSSIIS